MFLPFLSLRRRAAKTYFAILCKHRSAESILSSREGRVPPCEPPSFSWACRAHTRPGLSESPRTPLTAKACGPGPVFAFVLRSAAGQIRRLTDLPSCLAPDGDAQAKSRAWAPPLPPRRRFRHSPTASSLRKRQYDECVSIQAVCALRSTEGPFARYIISRRNDGAGQMEGAVQRSA